MNAGRKELKTCGEAATACVAMPTHLGNNIQRYNNVTSPIIAAAGIPTAHVFSASVPFYFLHRGCVEFSKDKKPDCTHMPFPSPVMRFAVLEVLSLVDELDKRRTED